MLAVFAGELGIEGGRTDRYPNSVHQLHASLGEILLDHDEDKRAWRHLLSAAFGVPDDGPVNLNLGRFYEKQERYNRALSRYVQAVIKVETGEKALEGLERVQRKMGDTKPLSVDTIAPLIAGKTYNYAAATRYRPEPGRGDQPREPGGVLHQRPLQEAGQGGRRDRRRARQRGGDDLLPARARSPC